MTVLAIAFWVSAGLLVYTHARLPGAPVAAGAASPGRAMTSPQPAEPLPSVSLIVAAHDEEASIVRWVRSTLAFDYPRERLEVVVVSDGSTDRTVEWAAKAGADLVLEVPRGGKVAALNAAVERARGEVLAFSDANSTWEPDALAAPGGPPRRPADRLRLRPASAGGRGRREPGGRSTGATRWPSGPSNRAWPASPPATGRSTRCAVRPTSRSSRPAARTSPSRTSSPSEAGAPSSSRARSPREPMAATLGSEFRRKRRMLAGAWATMLRHGMLSPRGYGPAYAFEILLAPRPALSRRRSST